MPGTIDRLPEVGDLVAALRGLGLQPILVGGMALVVLGSQRVTRDFDFVIAAPDDRLDALVELCYDRAFELASRVNDTGEVTATIDNRRIALARIRLDGPSGVYFFNRRLRLRVDLLFDYPVPAATLAARATRRTIRSRLFHIASEPDLLRLKQIAHANRAAPGDAQDIAFLEARLRKPRKTPSPAGRSAPTGAGPRRSRPPARRGRRRT